MTNFIDRANRFFHGLWAFAIFFLRVMLGLWPVWIIVGVVDWALRQDDGDDGEFWPTAVAIFLGIFTAGFLKTRSVFIAVKSKCGSVIPILVLLCADVNARGKRGVTPLHEAAKDGNAEIIPILVENGANVNAWDDHIGTSLHLAVIYENAHLIPVLFRHGADINAKIGFGPAPLHLAVEQGKVDAIFAILKTGVDVNVTNGDGWTPLHLAARMERRVRVARILINAGANVNAKDSEGLTPLDHAIKYKKPDIAELLKAKGTSDTRRFSPI